MTKGKFNHKEIEAKWQEKWEEERTYSPKNMQEVENTFYNLWMFPYPSAEGVHVGTIFSSTGSDVYGRYQRMNGKMVFQPFGYDSFGIHSENYAIKVGETPQKMLERTIAHYQRQFKMVGHEYDWNRTVTTSHVDYYRWTQWLFVQLFKAGLAYRAKHPVNWCPGCKTVIADEQIQTPAQAGKTPPGYSSVEDVPEGIKVCERCGNIPEIKDLEQWFFRITDYADKLLEGLTQIDWSERVVTAQKNWIGKKDGINITYQVKGLSESITCFTTTPVNFGATFLVITPDHSFVKMILNNEIQVGNNISSDIKRYASDSQKNKNVENKEKTGVFSGFYAINHVTGEEIPIWIADFVLSEVGTGAVQGCPGHDMRDFEFAKKFGIPIKRVVVGEDGDTSDIDSPEKVIEKGQKGTMINSDFLNGMNFAEAMKKTMDYFEEKGWGNRVTSFHLRDWLISRQRYWGPPIPMIHCDECEGAGKTWFDTEVNNKQSLLLHSKQKTISKALLHQDQSDWNPAGWYPVPEDQLPIELPIIEDYKPKGEGKGPLANHPEFYETICPGCGGKATRETDVSDTFLDSSWYFLRYPSIGSEFSENEPFDPEITKNWLPVDLYFGGAEHAVLHLMYARFVTKVLYDLGFLNFDEPFPRFFAHGLMIKDGAKMSKSRGNVVNPDEYIEKFGADSLRIYLMFMGPMDGYPDFRDTGIEGMRRFIEKVWKLFTEMEYVSLEEENVKEVQIKMHKTIKRVTEETENFRYNTAIASIMEYVNLLRDVAKKSNEHKNSESRVDSHKSQIQMTNDQKAQTDTKTDKQKTEVWNDALKVLAQLLAPFAPHMMEELWVEKLGQPFSVHTSKWPSFDPTLTEDELVTIVVQVNGKVRANLAVHKDDSQMEKKMVQVAKEDERIKKWFEGKEIKKEIFVPGKLVNFVIGE